MKQSRRKKIIKVFYEEVPISKEELERKLNLIYELIFDKILKGKHAQSEGLKSNIG